jgi:hypothetical protein
MMALINLASYVQSQGGRESGLWSKSKTYTKTAKNVSLHFCLHFLDHWGLFERALYFALV